MSEQIFIAVAKVEEVAPDTVKVVEVGGRSILLCNTKDRIFAVENQCSHAEEPLACGRIRNGWIACPAHGARFDLETGEAMNPPAKDPIVVFPVRLTGETIEIAV
ncbi:Rieske (2Fe-2S) protein [Sphingomonas cavernae]|uniref:Non-heme iron oxygenase ferredoxin subunit n=1 Tax=Sphingomonas cavernae TaxID=2320861 RepID=A0A418WMK2_9SPHN|nr:non-heme iron oxygenase ferredoxin subunit [Sphingomonas cavernae]RJF91239.1 non-heme iron oxygenase ferredoxin subunit [Sphingomonas cavernae]